ncbi:MAG: S46 family peptidase [Marinilabiliales bacterium]|nr:S46 family peptidase [Marinilabiliales bacterium]
MKKIILSLLIGLFYLHASAVEGMWIPTLLKRFNIEEMQKMGFKLTAEDIYDINHASMKDAVVLFGSGCTGELISGDGLLITNHHCGFGQIQKHSTLDHDYLSNGFWAANRKEELSNPGLTVQFLVKMEEVTSDVMKGLDNGQEDAVIQKIITENIAKIKLKFAGKEKYLADVKPLFYGNQYFVYVYQVFRDVRLVGAPPATIGKFGGDTDNWVWPRHTGDFSLFRIYAGKDNQPADYSPDNVPYHPKKFFPINLKGVKEGDFTMVFGFPGTTQEYLPSQAVKLIINQSNPTKVEIRTARLALLEKCMTADPKVKIQYAAKYANVANAWKKWQGETKGLVELHALDVKAAKEAEFMQWVNGDAARKTKYGNLFETFDRQYADLGKYQVAYDLYNEAIIRGSDVAMMVSRLDFLGKQLKDTLAFRRSKQALIQSLSFYTKDYDAKTDGEVFPALLKIFLDKVEGQFLPENVKNGLEKWKDNPRLKKIYFSSILTDTVRMKKLVTDFDANSLKKLQKDKLFALITSLTDYYSTHIEPTYNQINREIVKSQKSYLAAILEANEGRRMMADANLTLRVTYGKVEGYAPSDGVYFKHYTTLKGIMQKLDPTIADYVVPEKLKQLYESKDYAGYAGSDGEIPVAFCASNHTTGGNSGSPVINANGELIGVNFDRCWEGTMSDILFDASRCRNIALDIRYALFIIDRFAGAGYLLKEMNLIQ